MPLRRLRSRYGPGDDDCSVLQHIACEPPAAFEDELRSRGLDLVRVELDEGEPLPDWREFAGHDRDGRADGRLRGGRAPVARAEKRAHRARRRRRGPPGLGRLPGRAAARGRARRRACTRARRRRSACCRVELTAAAADDPVFARRAAQLPDAPVARRHLRPAPRARRCWPARPRTRNQAFVYERAYGLQFHLEVSPELAAEWGEVPAYADEPRGDHGARAPSSASSAR